MSFRRRTVMLAAGAVAAAIVIASVVVYFVTRGELLGQLDKNLEAMVTPGSSQSVRISPGVAVAASGQLSSRPESNGSVGVGGSVERVKPTQGGLSNISIHTQRHRGPHGEIVTIRRETIEGSRQAIEKAIAARGVPRAPPSLVLPKQTLSGPVGYVQLFQPNGKVLQSAPHLQLPVTRRALEVAAGKQRPFFNTITVAGARARTFTARAGGGGVWEAAVPLAGVDGTLSRLRLVLAVVCLGGIALAAAFGLIVSRAALRPVRRLTGAAERVARTQDLGHRIDEGGEDELGRLARSLNTMLGALERSRLSQRQLISDASHELRTPLTSVQANLDALAVGDQLAPAERARVVAAAQAQLRELTVLVGDLVDLSRTEVEPAELEHVRLDLATENAVARARLHSPACSFEIDGEPCLVYASPPRLDRAIANLLDNACKWDPGGPVEVTVRPGRLEVRDHGPGIEPEDLPRVFDRFYRAAAARAGPGSGLGLAIVRQFAESHGGAVHAANDPGGGARLTLELPVVAMTAEELQPLAALHEAPRAL